MERARKDKWRAVDAAQKAENRTIFRERMAEYRRTMPENEARRAAERDRYALNADVMRARKVAYRATNGEALRAAERDRYALNIEARRAAYRARYAKKSEANRAILLAMFRPPPPLRPVEEK